MRKLVGGDYLLDLTPIELEESEDGETYTNITNKEIIEQLTNLKKFVPNPSMVKPVWVKLINGETDEIVVVRGEFKVVDADEFEIVVVIDGYKLKIHIEFTQALNENNDPIDDWYIAENDAKYLFTSDAQNIGAISELPVFENIVDAQGHKRFIEIDGSVESVEGITNQYCKASLSGTHLLFVVCLALSNELEIANGETLATFTLPDWIMDKIVPVWQDRWVETKNVSAFGSDWSYQSFGVSISKYQGVIQIVKSGSLTLTANRNVRIPFDLLIDNDAPETQGE